MALALERRKTEEALSKVEAGRLELHLETALIAEICEIILLFVREQAIRKDLRLAELHGGSVAVDSEAGKGSRFTVMLLYTPPERTAQRQRHASRRIRPGAGAAGRG